MQSSYNYKLFVHNVNVDISDVQLVYVLMIPCFTDVNTTTPADCMRRFLAALNEQQRPTSTNRAAAATARPASTVWCPQNMMVPTTYAPGNMPPPGAFSPPNVANQVS